MNDEQTEKRLEKYKMTEEEKNSYAYLTRLQELFQGEVTNHMMGTIKERLSQISARKILQTLTEKEKDNMIMEFLLREVIEDVIFDASGVEIHLDHDIDFTQDTFLKNIPLVDFTETNYDGSVKKVRVNETIDTFVQDVIKETVKNGYYQ